MFDLRRAYEWTASLARWCARQPDLVRFRGPCLLYRAEVLQLRGHWDDAAQDAQGACELVISRPAAGSAFYRLGEIHRLRGEVVKAEAAYMRARRAWTEAAARPVAASSRQGQIGTAAASIRSVSSMSMRHTGRGGRWPRPSRFCSPRVTSRARARHLKSCRRSPARSERRCLRRRRARHGRGPPGGGRHEGASTSLRQACEIWRELETPYEEAQTCLLLAAVCDRRGDQDGRRLEVEAARRRFTQLDARRGLRASRGSASRHTSVSGPLSERERRPPASLPPARPIALSPRSSSSARRRWPATSAISSTSSTSEPHGRDCWGVRAQPLKKTQEYPCCGKPRLGYSFDVGRPPRRQRWYR